MRQSTTTTVSSRSHHQQNDSNFDALLEDLERTVSRSNSLRGRGPRQTPTDLDITGYREITTTIKDDATGENTTQYQIEYLHPSNTTTHITEYTAPQYNHHSQSGYGVAGQHNKQYQQVTYKYNQSKDEAGQGEIFDSRGGDAGRYMQEERRSREEWRAGSGTGARRELVFTGPRSGELSPSSQVHHVVTSQNQPLTQQLYRYEKTTSTKTIGPDGTVLYDTTGETGGDTARRGYAGDETEQFLRYRDPSPSGRITSNQSGYGGVKQTSYVYNSSDVSSHRERGARTPTPHRSSPAPSDQPPTPVRSSVSRTAAVSYPYDAPSSPSTAVTHEFSPSDNRTTYTYDISTPHQSLSSYKYTTTTTTTTNKYHHDNVPPKPRPFPSPSPTLQQQPPKKLDELMASLGEVDTSDTTDTRGSRVDGVRRETVTTTTTSTDVNRHRGDGESGGGPPHRPEATALVQQRTKEETRNVTGPPVYYPKGELFAKKEESMVQRESAGGGGKYKAKAKYQYESGSKYKESSDTKVVPVCVPCPCCCAAPCTIM